MKNCNLLQAGLKITMRIPILRGNFNGLLLSDLIVHY